MGSLVVGSIKTHILSDLQNQFVTFSIQIHIGKIILGDVGKIILVIKGQMSCCLNLNWFYLRQSYYMDSPN